MSNFEVKVFSITLLPHDNADTLEIAKIRGFYSVVRKGTFKEGDLVAYIPENSIVPLPLLKEMGLEGRLFGPSKNRVKAVKLRGVLSQGLCYKAKPDWKEGQEVSTLLGVEKWKPPLPSRMSGVSENVGKEYTLSYDIENIKRYPTVLEEGEEVIFSEKVHGTFCGIGFFPFGSKHPSLSIFSKGMGSKGCIFDLENEENKDNVYVRAFRKHRKSFLKAFPPEGSANPTFFLGEVYGDGIQDLSYGGSARKEGEIGYRFFDIYIGTRESGFYLNSNELDLWAAKTSLTRVPTLYQGPFNTEVVELFTEGRETVSGSSLHLREGIVIRPKREREHLDLGRVILKSVSEKYLTRKSGSEFQ